MRLVAYGRSLPKIKACQSERHPALRRVSKQRTRSQTHQMEPTETREHRKRLGRELGTCLDKTFRLNQGFHCQFSQVTTAGEVPVGGSCSCWLTANATERAATCCNLLLPLLAKARQRKHFFPQTKAFSAVPCSSF